MADRGQNHKGREIGTRPHPGEGPRSVGRTMGGGSLGHRPMSEVAREAELRNNPAAAEREADEPEAQPTRPERPRTG